MTIKIDHINIDRSEDPGYWYLWALDFNNAFKLLFAQLEKSLLFSSTIVIWCVYAQAIELYLKTYLLIAKEVTLKELRNMKKYGHNLENLRRKCAELDLRFNNEEIIWITQDIKKFTKMNWEDMKYPPKRSALSKKPKKSDNQHFPPMYGRKVMIAPLDFLEEIVRPLINTKD